MAPIAKAEAAVEMKANSRLTDGTYDVVFKAYKDKTNEASIASKYLKDAKVTIQGKKIVTLTATDSNYFKEFKVENRIN